MKTPRDILFARHQAATPKLDTIRREVVTQLHSQDARAQSRAVGFVPWCLGGANKLWSELILPCRRIWTGLAAAWVLIFVISFAQRDNVSSVTGKTVRPGATVISWQAQQRWMNELFAERSLPPEADRPRNFVPRPRTETFRNVTV